MKVLVLLIAMFFIACGSEETSEPCLLAPGEYQITSLISNTDCPEVFGEADGVFHDNGTTWSLKDTGFGCGETQQENWTQTVYTASCECTVLYEDIYYEVGQDYFKVKRTSKLECQPYYDLNDTWCNKKCSAEGEIKGNLINKI